MDTKDIQKAIYFYCKCRQNEYMVSNKHLHYWFEVDFMTISKAGYLTEFEIKQSKSDFKRDFSAKKVKHEWFKGKRDGDLLIESQDGRNQKVVNNFSENFTGIQQSFNMTNYKGPNYFYFVCPENTIDAKDIPEYAGLIYVLDNNTKIPSLKFIKKSPLLHKAKVDQERKINILTKYMYDYWKHNYEK
jgi:hypothetical protein